MTPQGDRIEHVLDEYKRFRFPLTRPQGFLYIQGHCRTLSQAIGHEPLVLVDEYLIDKYVRWRTANKGRRGAVRPQTIQKELGTLLSALRHWKQVTDATFRIPYTPKLKPKKHNPRVPTPERVRKIVNEALGQGETATALAVALAAELCLRSGSYQSIVSWQVSEAGGYFDLDRQEVTFQQTKKHDETWRRLSFANAPLTIEVIRLVHQVEPLRPPELKDRNGLVRVLAACKFPAYNFTSFRHYMVTRAKETGLNEWECTAITGHANCTLVRSVYGQLKDNAASAALGKIQHEGVTHGF